MKMFKAIVLTGIAFSQCGVEAAVVECGQQHCNSPARPRRGGRSGGAPVGCTTGMLRLVGTFVAGIQRSFSRAQSADALPVVDMRAELAGIDTSREMLVATAAMTTLLLAAPTAALMAVAENGSPRDQVGYRMYAAYFAGTFLTLIFLGSNPFVLPVVALMAFGGLNNGTSEANQAYRIITESQACRIITEMTRRLTRIEEEHGENSLTEISAEVQSTVRQLLDLVEPELARTRPMNNTPQLAALTDERADHTEELEN